MNPPKSSISLSQIPGLPEALHRAEQKQYRTRENSLLNLTYDLCGVRVRTMTVRDYVLLDRIGSPFVSRIEPTLADLAIFLWVLSPRFYFPFGIFRSLAAFLHGRKVRKAYGKDIPSTSEAIVIAAFDYVRTMFYDAPPAMSGGRESCISYLTGWFDAIQSEYYFTSDEVWNMGLPELFQRLAAIRQRNNPSIPTFNKDTDAVLVFIIRGLRSKQFSMDDLANNRVKLPDNLSYN